MGSGVPFGTALYRPDSLLDVSGTVVINPLVAPVFADGNLVAPYTGQILAGGTVNLSDTDSNNPSSILVAPGAIINVSGAAAPSMRASRSGRHPASSASTWCANRSGAMPARSRSRQ